MTAPLPRFILAGRPNSGKSALFNRLARGRAVVSNYPGTTVELLAAPLAADGVVAEVVDSPGLYALNPVSEEEAVSRDLLLFAPAAPTLVLHVVDAQGLGGSLPLTCELREAGLPVVLVLTMMDEARQAGVQVDAELLAAEMELPVFCTSAVTGEGVAELLGELRRRAATPAAPATAIRPLLADTATEAAIAQVAAQLPATPQRRVLARLLLAGDARLAARLQVAQPQAVAVAAAERVALAADGSHPEWRLLAPFHLAGQTLARNVLRHPGPGGERFRDRLSRWTMRPLTGLPILAAVLYFGLYKLVGGFGAGVLVDLLENRLFAGLINPWATGLAERWLPWAPVRELVTGEYGLVTMGLTYAVAIVLPIVAVFFLVFAVIEDSGYLPRLAMLLDRVCKLMGLSGRAVIPLVLGLGCTTMATMVTRTLPTRRERLLATLLLALAVPCSAQLGVILGVFAGHGGLLLVWLAVIGLIFLAVGTVAARLLPGERSVFYMELPPLRLPRLRNVLAKSWGRVAWYFAEVLPLFLLASVLIWLGRLSGLFDWLVAVMGHPVAWLGLPRELAQIFLFGFFRRDYGAAGLLELAQAGQLSAQQLLVASVAITLFLPCIAQFLMTVRERGWKTGVAVSVFVLFFAFGAAWLTGRLSLLLPA